MPLLAVVKPCFWSIFRKKCGYRIDQQGSHKYIESRQNSPFSRIWRY